MGAIDHWLDFLQNEKLCTNKKFDDYKSMVDVQAYMEHVEGRMRKYLDLVPLMGSWRSIGSLTI